MRTATRTRERQPTSPPLAKPDPLVARTLQRLRKGWCRGSFKRGSRHGDLVCLVGAFNEVRGVRFDSTRGPRLRRFIRQLGFSSVQDAIEWNDDRERTKEEVLERVERAAYGL